MSPGCSYGPVFGAKAIYASFAIESGASAFRFCSRPLIVAPIAYYPSYLTTGAHGLSGYLRDWLAFGDWPTGPAWFIWLLLAFDLAAAALFAIAPNFGEMLGRLTSNARQHPMRFFLEFVTRLPPRSTFRWLAIFGPAAWTSFGPFQFQTARLFHYALYFFTGIGVGAYGIEQGLLAPAGMLARHWIRWTLWMRGVFRCCIVFFLVAISKNSPMSPNAANPIRWRVLSRYLRLDLICLPGDFRALRHAAPLDLRQPERNEYGMYLIHYMFVSWLQFAMLTQHSRRSEKQSWSSPALLISWGASAALRRIPAVPGLYSRRRAKRQFRAAKGQRQILTPCGSRNAGRFLFDLRLA